MVNELTDLGVVVARLEQPVAQLLGFLVHRLELSPEAEQVGAGEGVGGARVIRRSGLLGLGNALVAAFDLSLLDPLHRLVDGRLIDRGGGFDPLG